MNKKIDQMSEAETKELLNDICAIFSIGSNACSRSAVVANIENAFRRSECLSRIEGFHVVTIESDEDDMDENYQVSELNWGHSPDQYLGNYRAVISRRYERKETPHD